MASSAIQRISINISIAYSLLNDGGVLRLLTAGINTYERHLYVENGLLRYITALPLILLYQLHLLIAEQAIAYPVNGGQWQIVHLLWFRRGRRLPALNPIVRTLHGSKEHQQKIEQIYTYPDFVMVEEGDIVIDVGAYIGSFTLVAADRASAVIAIEPNAVFDSSLEYNTAYRDNVHVIPKAAWKTTESLDLQLSQHLNENSILAVDSHATGDSVSVQADTVPNIVRDLGYETIGFLKIEAEGVECEILEAALQDDMRIEKIAVDGSPERDGEDPTEDIVNMLESNGYEYRMKDEEVGWGDNIIFGKHTGET